MESQDPQNWVENDEEIGKLIRFIVNRIIGKFGEVDTEDDDYQYMAQKDVAAREVARRILRKVDVYDMCGCPLCCN